MEKVSETIKIIPEFGGGFSYWVKKKGTNRNVTGKIYTDKSLCIKDAKLKDIEINKQDE